MRRLVLGMALSAMVGLSPIGATAADQEAAQRIAQSLRASGQLVDYSIGVQFEDGTAWLTGRVANQQQLTTAVQLAEGLPYVKAVVSQLEVQTGAASKAAKSRPTLKDSTLNFLGVKSQQASFDEPQEGDAESDISQVAANQVVNDPGDPLAKSGKAKFAPAPSRRFSEAPVVNPPAAAPQKPAGNKPVSYEASSRIPAKPAVQTRNNVPVGIKQMISANPTGFRRHAPAPVCNDCGPGGHGGGMGGMGGGMGGGGMGGGYGPGGAMSEQPNLPNYAWPGYAANPNYAAVTYPTQYSATAWPFIGPFYPYPQVPLGWRKVTLEWDDGWWWLDFKDRHCHH